MPASYYPANRPPDQRRAPHGNDNTGVADIDDFRRGGELQGNLGDGREEGGARKGCGESHPTDNE